MGVSAILRCGGRLCLYERERRRRGEEDSVRRLATRQRGSDVMMVLLPP